jgi:hypothetical protein
VKTKLGYDFYLRSGAMEFNRHAKKKNGRSTEGWLEFSWRHVGLGINVRFSRHNFTLDINLPFVQFYVDSYNFTKLVEKPVDAWGDKW